MPVTEQAHTPSADSEVWQEMDEALRAEPEVPEFDSWVEVFTQVRYQAGCRCGLQGVVVADYGLADWQRQAHTHKQATGGALVGEG